MTFSRKVITGSRDVPLAGWEQIGEYSGRLAPGADKGLMRAVLENDKGTVEEGKLIADAINQGVQSFTASKLFEQLVKNYSVAQQVFGESIIRRITGYEPGEVRKNIRLPEFQRELLRRIEERVDRLREDRLIDREGNLTERAADLAGLILYTEELDNLLPEGITGERKQRKEQPYGIRDEERNFQKERYSDIAIRKTLKRAIMRRHEEISIKDLMSFKRKGRGRKSVIYAIDASGSMKGEKLGKCKKAGIALAYKAIDEKDDVGLIVFGTGIKSAIRPTQDFPTLLREITRARAAAQTDLAGTIHEASMQFEGIKGTRHLLLITDGLPTKGESPEKDTLEAASAVSASGVTISIIGIELDQRGRALAEKIVEVGRGRLFIVRDLKEIDKLVLLDYYEA
ncbi:VWA domain-containing protein [Candidatus Woesearchaeota archaeon]|nr:VWA domain-containing protein [Candidatus Woesearchaeota archaeon]